MGRRQNSAFLTKFSPLVKRNKVVIMNETEHSAVMGTCLTMCPMAEVALREREILVHPFETLARTAHHRCPKGDLHKMVKAYSRPAAGRVDPSPNDLRPAPVLIQTVQYLLDKIVPRTDYRWHEVYYFVCDRLRAVRQDMIIQDIRGPSAIQILESVVQFHVNAGYRLCTEPIVVFDPKLNDSHTQECLKRLLYLYQETEGCHDNQVLFESIYVLYNLGNSDSLLHYLSLDKNIRNSPLLNLAYKISVAFTLGNYVRVLRLAKSLPSVICLCAVHRHFSTLKRRTLQTMSSGYSSKNLYFPLVHLTKLLPLNYQRDAEELCRACGLQVKAGKVQFLKAAFKGDASITPSKIHFIDDKLTKIPIEDILKISADGCYKQQSDDCENWGENWDELSETNTAAFLSPRPETNTADFLSPCPETNTADFLSPRPETKTADFLSPRPETNTADFLSPRPETNTVDFLSPRLEKLEISTPLT